MTSFLSFPKDGGPHSGASVGQALAGLVARDSSGLPRVGMLAAPEVEAVAASWKVQVGRFVYVHQVNGAVQFSGLSEAEQKDITPATAIPAGQSRIDRVVWNPVTSALTVLTGTAAASPTPPALGANAAVARVLVKSGDGSLASDRVTPDYQLTKVGDVVLRTFSWNTARVTVVRSELEVSAGWARLRFHVTAKGGAWSNGTVLGSMPAGLAPVEVEFSPVSITPVGPVGNVAARPDGQLYLYATSGTVAIGDVGWPVA